MHVDRSRFLLLTASLAACTNPKVAPDPANPGTTGAGSSTSSSVNATSGEATSSSVWLEIEPGTEDPAQRFDPGACNNSIGTPKSCESLSAPGPQCESFFESQRFCEMFPRAMRPRAAEAAVDCMLAMSGSQAICDWTAWQTCVEAGMRASCVEPATHSLCSSVSAACGGGVDVFACQQAIAAAPVGDAQRVSSCIQEFCEVPFCVVDMALMF